MDDELRPLLTGDLELELRAALEAGLDDGPSPESVQAAALALGLSVGAAKGVAAGVAGQGIVKGASSSWLLKWFGIGLLVGGVSSSGVALMKGQVEPSSHHSASPAEADPAHRAPTSLQPAQPESTRKESGDPKMAELTPPAVAAPAVPPEARAEPKDADVASAPPASAASFPSATRQADLRAEVLLIDAARRSLAAGNAQGALVELGRYDALVGPKRLAPEALVLRVRALSQLGRTQEARALAQPVIASQPDSAQSKQLQKALGLE
ncbi:MAG: hypothetical protein H6718_23095 [Polyangiaceae bacterium]|nr:hypothetical protein [Myxococcales bacterium]MCB9588313.1 hypothetical protein [Polyangiaceae bacterium]